MPERSGIEIVGEDKFSPTFRKFEEALKKSEVSSATFARALRTQAQETDRLAAAMEKGALAQLNLGKMTAEQATLAFKAAEALRVQAKALHERADVADKGAKTEAAGQKTIGTALSAVALQYAAVAAAATAAFATIRKAVELANVAAEAQNIKQSFYVMAQGTGVAADDLLAAMSRAAGGTVEQTKLMRIANRAFLADATGAFARELPRLMEIARATSLATGQSFEYVFDTLVTGIAKGSPLLIDNAEIYLRLGQAVDEYAKSMGRSADDLTPYERRMATLSAVLDQGQEVVDRFGGGLEDQTQSAKQAEAALADMNIQIGEALLPLTRQWTQAKADLLKQLIPLVEKLKDFVAYVHIGGMALVEFINTFGKWYEIILLGPAAAIPALIRAMGDAEARQETWNRIGEKSLEIWDQYHRDLADVGETIAALPPLTPPEPPDYEKIAGAVESTLDRIGKMQRDRNRQLQRETEDVLREQEKAWANYEKSVAKAIQDGGKKLEKLEADYGKKRAKVLADYQKKVAEVEADGQKERIKAQQDFERQARQSRERFQLSQVQSERRYQHERGRLVAEGDTLAIEELDARYKLERQEAAENEALRERQDRENQAAQIREAGEAAREQLREMETQLGEQLAEQEASYLEQIEAQRQANAERLGEMAADFAERQRAEDEDRRIAAQRRDEDYRLQLEELGASLADQLREHEYGAEDVARLLEQYYGAGGVADRIMQGYHEREAERIAVTAEQLAAMSQAVSAPTYSTPEEAYGRRVHMDVGGVVRGPASVAVGPGVTEAFIPLGGIGGTLNVTGNVGVNVSGLETANPADVSSIASALAMELTSQARTLRRS